MTNSIQNISKNDVLKINSSQVIIDLRTIVKELIENSIDANSTKIELSFVNYGIESISIQDDGTGVQQEDFKTLCLRSHTSKITSFEDLNILNTLGFRGEALNSICSLSSKVSIKTNTKTIYPKNFTLIYDNMGQLISESQKIGGVSNKSGTLVIIENLFQNLPVRHKNFITNAKREFHKAVNFMINYLLIYPGIKFTVYNTIPSNNKKQVVLSSKGGPSTSIIDNLISIYGNNQNKNLLELNIEISEGVHLNGYISSYSFGLGRSASDRQFLFINRRPINFKNLSKLINEVYKQFNHVQFPIYVLNITIDPNSIDVNLLPDKSNILIHNEFEILDKIRDNLILFFESQNKVLLPKNDFKVDLAQDTSSPVGITDSDTIISKKPEGKRIGPLSLDVKTKRMPAKDLRVFEAEEDLQSKDNHEAEAIPDSFDDEHNKDVDTIESSVRADDDNCCNSLNFDASQASTNSDHSHVEDTVTSQTNIEDTVTSQTNIEDTVTSQTNIENTITSQTNIEDDEIATNKSDTSFDKHGVNFYPVRNEETLNITVGRFKFEEKPIKNWKIGKKTDLHKFSKQYTKSEVLSSLKNIKFWNESNGLPQDNQINVNEDLNDSEIYHISKNDFLKMQLIGQFNLGFILVKHGMNLFIVDQHASDEKFNFEKLLESFRIDYQPLIVKQNLDLNIIDEMLVLDNENIFRNNGFKFMIENDKTPGSRISLSSLPVYKKKMFELDDFYELVNMISEEPGNKNLKCSKIRKMVAMKACRSSIMIGTYLSDRKMTELVRNLSTLDKPWNCPHGRPTMRHLTELRNWHNNYYDYSLQ